MRSLRRLSAVSIACLPAILLLSCLRVQAQSAPPPSDQPPPSTNVQPFVIHVSPLFAAPSAAPQQSQPFTTYRLPPLSAGAMHTLNFTPTIGGSTRAPLLKRLDAQELALNAGNEASCYALRTYGFTTPPGSASAPHLSSYKTCTPASQAHVKELVKAPQATK